MVDSLLQSASRTLEVYLGERAGLGPGTSVALIGPNGWSNEIRTGVQDVLTGGDVSEMTRFQIGSISKSIVAAAYAELSMAGTVDLHAPVAGVSDWIELADPDIEIAHLLSHQSGLMSLDDTVPASRYAVWKLKDSPLGFKPGTGYHYSNVGYLALGYLLEELTSESLEVSLEELVFRPRGMRNTYAQIGIDPDALSATGHYLHDGRHRPLPHSPIQGGHAAVTSTAREMARFLAWILDEGPIPTKMIVPRADSDWPGYAYGLGLFIGKLDSFGGHRIVQHSGENPGFEAVMIGDLDTSTGVVLLTNSYCSPWPPAYYALSVLNAVLDGSAAPGEPDLPKEPAHPGVPRNGGRLEGHYRAHAPMINEYTVFRRAGDLMVDVNGSYEEFLVERDGGQYSIGTSSSPERVEFGPFVDGQALACTVNGGVYVRF